MPNLAIFAFAPLYQRVASRKNSESELKVVSSRNNSESESVSSTCPTTGNGNKKYKNNKVVSLYQRVASRNNSESELKQVAVNSSRNNSESESVSSTSSSSTTGNGNKKNKNNNKVVPARKLSKMMSKGTIVFQDVGGVYMLIHKPTGQWVMKNGEYLEFVTPRKTSNSED